MVSLATPDELRDAPSAEQANADQLAWQAAQLNRQAEDRFAEAGALMVPRRAWWQVPAELSPLLAEAERLVARILLLDERIADLERAPQPDVRHGISKIRGWVSKCAAQNDRVRAATQLRRTLVMIARTGARAGVAVPDVEPVLEQATELQARAEGLRAALAATSSRLSALESEIRLREVADRQMGFDSLYLGAHFQMHGLPAIQSPLKLEAGEVAYLATDAALARMPTGTQHARSGSGSGVSVTYTGIRHWIGTVRNHSAPLRALRPIDTGTLVVSSLRLAFIGSTQSVAISLDAVVDVDVYTDAIALSRLGREVPDFFLVTAPRQVAFYLNWAMSTGMVG